MLWAGGKWVTGALSLGYFPFFSDDSIYLTSRCLFSLSFSPFLLTLNNVFRITMVCWCLRCAVVLFCLACFAIAIAIVF